MRQAGAEIGCGHDYLSKVITGRIGSPSEEFLGKAAAALGHPKDKLAELAGKRLHGDAKLTLLFAHSVWGAPVLDAAREGRLESLRVASFASTGFVKESPDASNKLCFIVPGEDHRSKPPGPGSDSIALSARDVLFMLRRGLVDIGAVAGNVVPDEEFLRVGTIVNTVAGCVLLGGPPLQELLESVAGDQLSTQHLQKFLKQKKKWRLAVEERTVAHEFLADACQSETLLRRRQWLSHSSWFGYMCLEDLQTKCDAETKEQLLGCITWEPHASWIEALRRNKGLEDLRRWTLRFAASPAGRARHYSYELIVRRDRMLNDPKANAIRKTLVRLMFELTTSAARFNALSEVSSDPDLVGPFARYFKLPSGRASRIAAGVLYSVYWTDEGQREVAKLFQGDRR